MELQMPTQEGHGASVCGGGGRWLQHSPPLGRRSWCGERANPNLKGAKLAQDAQGFCSNNWAQTPPLEGGDGQ